MVEHLTIPGALEWDAVERHSIATLRYAGGKEHDVKYVSEVAYDALAAELKALREAAKNAEPVAEVIATGGPHDMEDRVFAELQAELPPIGTKVYAYPPSRIHTMKSIMEAVEASSCYTVLTSNQCHALAQVLNGLKP